MPNLLQSQLTFFGAIDAAVLYAQHGGGPNPAAVLRTVEALLPGTTGFGQAGWYGELEAFANREEVSVGDVRSVIRFPTVAEALRNLSASAVQQQTTGAAAVRVRVDSAPGSPARDEPYDPTQDPALARSAYAGAILAKIARVNGLPPELGMSRTMPARIVASSVRYWQGSTTRVTAADAAKDPTVQNLFGQLDEINSRQSWENFAATQVSALFAQQSLPCFGKLDSVDGQFVSTMYTDMRDAALTVKNIEKIIDPRNWSLCCSFFCAVDAQDPPYTKRGWSRILEKISPEPEKWCLKTALVFYYGRDEAGGIFLNYDLDPHRQNDSGLVEVDKGYIWITPLSGAPGKKGVRIRTSKQERVQGLSPTATSALACLLGWGDAAFKLVAGTAYAVIQKKVPSAELHPFVITPPKDYKSQVDHNTQSTPKADPPQLPPNFRAAVENGRDLLDDLINRTRDIAADTVTRWLDGVSPDDVKAITGNVGKNLQEFATEVYDKAEASVKPQDTPTGRGRR